VNDFPLMAADRLIMTALEEDVGTGDITTLSTVAPDTIATAKLIAKSPLRLAGLDGFKRVFTLLAPGETFDWEVGKTDGDDLAPGETVLTVTGNARALLTGERVALNLLGKLSSVATITAAWAKHLEDTNAKLIDTRKTTPGLRALEKYAVRVGGGANHRAGLFDGVLIKENHIRAAGSIEKAVQRARDKAPHMIKIEVEVTTMKELEEAYRAGADAALLDNMDNDMMTRAVKRWEGKMLLEASGNMSEERLASVAATGVDLISAGALTHSAPCVDLSLLFVQD
jgi:nicotinate-nucleotide pyrophosphorylase (carboxylating)